MPNQLRQRPTQLVQPQAQNKQFALLIVVPWGGLRIGSPPLLIAILFLSQKPWLGDGGAERPGLWLLWAACMARQILKVYPCVQPCFTRILPGSGHGSSKTL